MKRETWVKAQLRLYLFRDIDLSRIEKELAAFPDNEIRNLKANKKKERVVKQVKVVEKALNDLTPFHRSLIDKTFLSLDYTDKKLGQELNLPVWAVRAHRRAALSHLYDSMTLGYSEGLKSI